MRVLAFQDTHGIHGGHVLGGTEIQGKIQPMIQANLGKDLLGGKKCIPSASQAIVQDGQNGPGAISRVSPRGRDGWTVWDYRGLHNQLAETQAETRHRA